MINNTLVKVPILSVNDKTGAVLLDNIDVGAAAIVHTHIESDITDLGTYIEEAPLGTTQYGRENGAWTPIITSGIEEAPINTLPYIREDGDWVEPRINQTGISSTSIGIKINNATPATGYTIPSVTQSTAGLMSSIDKIFIDSLSVAEDNYIYTAPTTGTAVALNAYLATIPKDLNGYTLQISFASSIEYALTEDIIFERFYNGNISVFGAVTAIGIQNTSISTNNIYFKSLTAVEVLIKYLDFQISPLINKVDKISFYQCSFNRTVPDYVKFIETPLDLYDTFNYYISITNSYYYGACSVLYSTSSIPGEGIADIVNCSSASKVGNIVLGPSRGVVKIYYNGFVLEDLVTNTDVSGDNIWITNVNENAIVKAGAYKEVEIAIYIQFRSGGNVLVFALKDNDVVLGIYESLKEATDRIDGNLNGGTLQVTLTHTTEGNIVLPYDTTNITRPALNLGKFSNGNINMKGFNNITPSSNCPVYTEILTRYLITVSAFISLNMQNLEFIVPSSSTMRAGIAPVTTLPVEGVFTLNGNITADNCVFDFENLNDGFGIFAHTVSRAAFYACEFRSNSAYSDNFIFDDITEVRPTGVESDWKFIDCITPADPSKIFTGIIKEASGSYINYGFVNVAGNTGFVGATIASTVRRIDHA